MQLSISAAGTKEEVKKAIVDQTKQFAKTNGEDTGAQAAAYSVRDYVARKLEAVDPGTPIEVKASIEVSLKVGAAKKDTKGKDGPKE